MIAAAIICWKIRQTYLLKIGVRRLIFGVSKPFILVRVAVEKWGFFAYNFPSNAYYSLFDEINTLTEETLTTTEVPRNMSVIQLWGHHRELYLLNFSHWDCNSIKVWEIEFEDYCNALR